MANATVIDAGGNLVKGAYVGADGKTRLSDGSRIPAGYRVQTGDGNLWEMGSDGVGKLVRNITSENPPVVNNFTGASINKTVEPKLYTAADLASMYGIDNSVSGIEARMRNAAASKFDQLDADYAKLEGQYGDNIGKAADVALDTLRKTRSDAIQTGASNAKEAASALSAMLGIGQTGAQGAQEVALAGAQLKNTRASELAAVPQAAAEYANQVNLDLSKLAYQLNSNDVARYGAGMNALVGLDANESGLLAQQGTNDTNLKIASAQAAASVAAAKAGAARAVQSGASSNDAWSSALANIDALGYGKNTVQYLKTCILAGAVPDDKRVQDLMKMDNPSLAPDAKATRDYSSFAANRT